MRLGHKYSGGFEKRFQAHTEVKVVLVSIPQRQLIDQHRSKRESPRVGEPFGWHLPVGVEHPLELLVQVLNRSRAQAMKHAPHLDPIISMWVCATSCGNQDRKSTRMNSSDLGIS